VNALDENYGERNVKNWKPIMKIWGSHYAWASIAKIGSRKRYHSYKCGAGHVEISVARNIDGQILVEN
jgi:hypothetical protein